MYAKLINGYPSYSPKKIKLGDNVVYNPLPEQLLNLGYMPVIEAAYPEVEDGYYAVPYYEIENGSIIEKWNIIESDADEDDFVNALSDLGVLNNDEN